MAQIFISYSKQDIAFARHLRALLQSAGFDVWLDEKLVPSTQWWRMLERQIKASSVLVVVMSPSSAESRWVEREILVAENANIPIFPVLLEGEVWSRLADIQAEDLTAGLNATLPERFIEAIRAVIDGRPIARTATQPVKAPLTQVATERRLLESAMPAETETASQTELWAKITLPDSPGLREELPAVVPSGDVIQKSDARTTSFPFRFPIDPQTGQKLPAQVLLRAASADFAIRSPGGDDTEIVELPPDSDSRTIIFTLSPKPGGRTSGRARVFVDLIYEGKVIAQIACSTLVVNEVTRTAAMRGQWGLWSVPVGNTVASAGGYAAPGAAAATAPMLDDLLVPEALDAEADEALVGRVDESAYAERIPAKEAAAPQGGEAPEASPAVDGVPAPPPRVAPTPRPAAPITPPQPDLARKRGESSTPPGGRQGSPVPAARGARTFNFPMATSAVAALVVVFGVVFIALNGQQGSPALSTSPTADTIALAFTDTAQSLATPTPAVIGIASTIPNITPSTGTENTTAPPAPEDTPTPVPTDPPSDEPPILPTAIDQPDDTQGDSPQRQGVAAARLMSCESSANEYALFTLLETAGIPFNGLEADPVDAVVAEQINANGAEILFWGSCFSDGTIWVTAEVLAPPQINGLLHPTTLQMAAPNEAVNDAESPLSAFAQGVTRYTAGWFDGTTQAALTRAREAVLNPPDELWQAAQSLNLSNGVADDLAVMLGTTVLVAGEDYDTALNAYNSVPAESPSIYGYPVAQNNIGALLMNRTYQSIQGGADIYDPLVQETLDLTDTYLAAAQQASSDRAHLLTITLNRAMLNYLLRAIGDTSFTEAAENACKALAEEYPLTSAPVACKSAAVFNRIHFSGASCADPGLLELEFAVLSEAIEDDPADHEAYYWRARYAQLLSICAPLDDDDDDDQSPGVDWAAQTVAEFQAYLDRVPEVRLAIERAFVEEAGAYTGAG